MNPTCTMELTLCVQRIKRCSRGTALRTRVALVIDSYRCSHSLTQYGSHFRQRRIEQSVKIIPASTNPNVVIMSASITRDIHSNYGSRSSYVLGGIQAGMGVALFIANFVVIASHGAYFSKGRSVREFGGCVLVSW